MGKTFNNINRIEEFSATVNAASMLTAVVNEEDFTVAGVPAGGVLLKVEAPADYVLVIGDARVKAANTITIQFSNPTAGTIDAAAGTFKFYVARPD